MTLAVFSHPLHAGLAWRGEGDLVHHEKLGAEEKKALREKRESLENTPVGQNLAALLGGGTPKRKPSRENQSMSTPYAILSSSD